jgi:hypothetical protein
MIVGTDILTRGLITGGTVRGVQVNYKSAEKYIGSDELELLVLFPAGTAWEVRDGHRAW